MPYFNKKLMSLDRKKDVSLVAATDTNKISAVDYNLHDEEINAIEVYLGFDLKNGETRIFRSQGRKKNIFERVESLTKSLNSYSLDGISSVSGNSLSGFAYGLQNKMSSQKMNAISNPISFLTKTLNSRDNFIDVISTNGFPDRGVLTVVAPLYSDLVQNTVEYISYEGKTNTSFVNCKRGFLGTTPVEIGLIRNQTKQLNKEDDCFSPRIVDFKLCKNKWPAIKNTIYEIVPFGIIGEKHQIIIELINNISNYRLEPNTDLIQEVRNIITESEILEIETIDGKDNIVSLNSIAKKQKRLTGYEASQFFELMFENEDLVKEYKSAEDVEVGQVPVFSGQVSIQYSPVFWRKNTEDQIKTRDSFYPKPGFSVIQDKSNIGLLGAENPNVSSGVQDIVYAAVNYQIFSIPNPKGDD